jgi:hypothetical protein
VVTVDPPGDALAGCRRDATCNSNLHLGENLGQIPRLSPLYRLHPSAPAHYGGDQLLDGPRPIEPQHGFVTPASQRSWRGRLRPGWVPSS